LGGRFFGTGWMGTTNNDLERMLAGTVRAYFRACDRADVREQYEQARAIGSTLARLLGNRLETSEHWNRYRWVDDLLSPTFAVPSPGALEARGWMVWAEDSHCAWVEPFFARVQLTADGESIQAYTLSFGAPDGLARTAYASRSVPKLAERTFTNDWLVVFRKGGGRMSTGGA
jgi:hypothetical protein